MRNLCIVAVALVAAGGTVFAQSVPSAADLRQRADLLKPLPERLKWQQIPWGGDLAEAQKRARQEKRPLLIWASGDDPLERC